MPNSKVVHHIIQNGGKGDTTAEWVEQRTGIKERHIANPVFDETTSILAMRAAKAALSHARLTIDDIGKIIVATVTPDTGGVPSTASVVHQLLGGTMPTSAYDINAGCSGFLYALQQAWYAAQYECSYVLVIGAECLSRITDWSDRNTAPLFGDGAGAVVLARGDDAYPGLYPVITSGNGKREVLTISEETRCLTMDGRAVFTFAVKEGCRLLQEIMERDKLSPNDVDWIFPHQANLRINQQIREALEKRLRGIPKGRMCFDESIVHYGNTSAASIPIALARATEKGHLHNGDHVLMVAFGAGLTYAAAHVVWRTEEYIR